MYICTEIIVNFRVYINTYTAFSSAATLAIAAFKIKTVNLDFSVIYRFIQMSFCYSKNITFIVHKVYFYVVRFAAYPLEIPLANSEALWEI